MINTSFIRNTIIGLVKFTSKHAPEILAGVGIGGFVTTTVLAVKATPEAINRIEEKKEELQVEELTTIQTVKAVWEPYFPAVLTGVSSTLCVIGSVSTSLRRNAALATAYEMSRTFMEDYRAEVINTVGAKKEEKIMHEVHQKRIDDKPPTDEFYSRRPNGKQAFLFAPTGTYFWSSLKDIDDNIEDVNAQVKNSTEGYIGVVDAAACFGVLDNMPQIEKDLLIDNWTYFGYSSFHQGKFVEFSCDRALIDRKRGQIVGVVDANLKPMDDYWTYEPK